MRLAAPVLAAVLALAATAPASAATRTQCTRAMGDYEGGPNAYLMWTDPYKGSQAGYAYIDAGLTCVRVHRLRHRYRHVLFHPRRHSHKLLARVFWVDVPIENRGGLCPKGDCDLLANGARKHPA